MHLKLSQVPRKKKQPTDADSQKTRNSHTTKKKPRFVDIGDTDSSEDDTGKRPSNAQFAREANRLYIEFASKTMPAMFTKKSKCMDKFLKEKILLYMRF